MAKKYIDAEKLASKVKELNITTKTYEEQVSFSTALLMVIELIDTLSKEQQEVDLEKEIEEYWMATDWGTVITLGKFKVIARYFYGLGQLNSK